MCQQCSRHDRVLIPKRASTVQTRLGAREISIASRDRDHEHFRSIPPRLTVPIERVLDRDVVRALKASNGGGGDTVILRAPNGDVRVYSDSGEFISEVKKPQPPAASASA